MKRSKQKQVFLKSRNKSAAQPKNAKRVGVIRLIAGQWRGRKLPVLPLTGLRPTPDRVRETLFNWLQGDLYQARCLDLFAGSGALGFEAISRGAANVVMVEKNRLAAQQLADNITLLKTEQIQLQQGDAYDYLKITSQTFDIIFLDPPFHNNHIEALLAEIMQRKLLNPQGLIYLEYESEIALDLSKWSLKPIKQTQAGQSQAVLLSYLRC